VCLCCVQMEQPADGVLDMDQDQFDVVDPATALADAHATIATLQAQLLQQHDQLAALSAPPGPGSGGGADQTTRGTEGRYICRTARGEVLEFGSLQDLTEYQTAVEANRAAARKMRTVGDPPKMYSADSDTYLWEHFLEAFVNHVDLATAGPDKGEASALMYSRLCGAAKEHMRLHLQQKGCSARAYGWEAFVAELKTFSCLQKPEDHERLSACFRTKLGEKPIDEYISGTVAKCLLYGKTTVTQDNLQIAAVFQGLPHHLQQLVNRMPTGESWSDFTSFSKAVREAYHNFGSKARSPNTDNHNN
jgi:hypothetical protein